MMMAGNRRVGKSEGCGLYETVLHMTGRYPDWWRGRGFNPQGYGHGDFRETVSRYRLAASLTPVD